MEIEDHNQPAAAQLKAAVQAKFFSLAALIQKTALSTKQQELLMKIITEDAALLKRMSR